MASGGEGGLPQCLWPAPGNAAPNILSPPTAGSLSALVYQHSIIPLALPCKLVIPNRGRNLRLLALPARPRAGLLCVSAGSATPECRPRLEDASYIASSGGTQNHSPFLVLKKKKRKEKFIKSLIPGMYIIDLAHCSGKFSRGLKKFRPNPHNKPCFGGGARSRSQSQGGPGPGGWAGHQRAGLKEGEEEGM